MVVQLRHAADLGETFYDDLRDLMQQKRDAEAYLRLKTGTTLRSGTGILRRSRRR